MKVFKTFVFAKTITISLVMALATPAFGLQMFENAERRDRTPSEGAAIVSVTVKSGDRYSKCTGFFVANKGNKPYIMTARHCAKYEMAKACSEGRITFKTENGAIAGVCKAAAIETKDLDETLLLADFANWESDVRPEIAFYTLSDQRPRVGTRVQMLGYPADPTRRGAFTITDNCWISGERMVNIYDYPQQAEAMRTKFTAIATSNNLFSLLRHRMPAFHNCSVYGGNSGGPIIKEGTSIVLGLPTSFFPDASKVQPQTLSTSMDATADFIVRNRKVLKQLGVQWTSPYSGGAYIPPYQVGQDPWGRQVCYQTNQIGLPSAQPAAMSYCEQ